MNGDASHPIVNLLTDESGDSESRLNRFIKAFCMFYVNDFTHLKSETADNTRETKSNSKGITINRWMMGMAITLSLATVAGIIAILIALI